VLDKRHVSLHCTSELKIQDPIAVLRFTVNLQLTEMTIEIFAVN